jgi:hypothetical protein
MAQGQVNVRGGDWVPGFGKVALQGRLSNSFL